VTALIAISESGKQLLYPKAEELILGAVAFAILFVFMAKWAIPRINTVLEERRAKIQGDLEKAEQSKTQADQLLADYRTQLAGAREQANRVIEEAHKTAEALRRDMTAKAEQEYQGIVARAQDEIRAERDRVFQELRAQVGELSIELAARVVGAELDKERQLKLVDDYITELGAMSPAADGNGERKEG